MSPGELLDLWRSALTVLVAVSAPFLVAGLVVGLVIAIIQTATQLQESVLAFVPKVVVALVVMAVAGHWMLDRLGRFATQSFTASLGARSPGGATPPSPTPLTPPTTP